MRWSASLAVIVVAACHGPPPTAAPAPSCKVAAPVCNPTVSDADALAVVQHRCAGCHAEGGRAAHPLLDPVALGAARGNVAERLAGCEMPPDATPFPPDERARLIGWAACRPAR